VSAESPSRIKAEFADWMRSHLGYHATETNVPVADGHGTLQRVVGVRGETYGATWRHLRSVAIVAFAAAAILRNVVPAPDGDVPIVPYALLSFAAVAYLVARIGRARTREYSWVECKDPKRPVSRGDILSLDRAVKQVRASEAAGWKPARVLVVAGAKGFESDAVPFAWSLGIECYRRTSSGFDPAT
jgi:hypothetical protein